MDNLQRQTIYLTIRNFISKSRNQTKEGRINSEAWKAIKIAENRDSGGTGTKMSTFYVAKGHLTKTFMKSGVIYT